MGGETCAVNSPRSDCTTAMEELERFHFSYLNWDYNLDVLNSWSGVEGCIDNVMSHLGYQLVIGSDFIRRIFARWRCIIFDFFTKQRLHGANT